MTMLQTLLLAALLSLAPTAARSQAGGDDTVVQARDALRKKDRAALFAARQATAAANHPLAMWVDYWELANRLGEAQQGDLNAFYARWPGSYVEDRLRNDWLLELGRRRDWPSIRAEFPRFRMNDDREVTCYALQARHLEGADVRAEARAAVLAQREADDGCATLARTLTDARVLTADDAWAALRQAAEFNRPRMARAAAALVDPATEKAVGELFDNPQRWLQQRRGSTTQQLELLALMRLAAADPDAAVAQLEGSTLPPALAAHAWAVVAKQAALKQQPQAADHARRAWRLWDGQRSADAEPPWGDDLVAWHVRAALRLPAGDGRRWSLVLRAVQALSPAEQRDAAWQYWKARAQQATARPGAEGDADRAAARAALEAIAGPLGFYNQLAAEELGGAATRHLLPGAPAAPSSAERAAARAQPGLQRALLLVALGLRNEGVREWNFMLRGLDDRGLLAAAQWACEREVWDRCINTSERTRIDVDVAQRFPLPWRAELGRAARESGIDQAVLYGLIRQESRFIADARSHVGASGLMQLMPDTARWTARKIGLDFRPEMVNDREVNLRLGAAYLKRVLDDFGGSLAMAAAGYNAGPGRPRRWRESAAPLEPAAWAETIPFNETRDYVKKVLSNSVTYSVLLGAPAPQLKARLGAPVGPRDPAAAPADREIP